MEYRDLKPEMSGKGEYLIDLILLEVEDVSAILVLYNGEWFACQDVHDGISIPDKHGKKYSCCISPQNCRNIRLKHRTIHDVRFEDVIVCNGEKRKVLARINNVVIPSAFDDYDKASTHNLTVKELEELGYTLEETQPEEEVVVTMDELIKEYADRKGVDVSRIKVKKD